MGKQNARLIFKGKDHKDIYYQGKYHDKMYRGSELLWEKIGIRMPKWTTGRIGPNYSGYRAEIPLWPVYGNGIFVISREHRGNYISTDGFNWTLSPSHGSQVSFCNGLFVRMSYYPENNIEISSDAVNWSVINVGIGLGPYFTYQNGIYATKNFYGTSLGKWARCDEVEVQGTFYFKGKHYIADIRAVKKTTDFVSFEYSELSNLLPDAHYHVLTVVNGFLVARYRDGFYYTSDGENWAEVPIRKMLNIGMDGSTSWTVESIVYGFGTYICFVGYLHAFESYEAVEWVMASGTIDFKEFEKEGFAKYINVTSPRSIWLVEMVFKDGKFIGLGNTPIIGEET